jgi:hypothetical protein
LKRSARESKAHSFAHTHTCALMRMQRIITIFVLVHLSGVIRCARMVLGTHLILQDVPLSGFSVVSEYLVYPPAYLLVRVVVHVYIYNSLSICESAVPTKRL